MGRLDMSNSNFERSSTISELKIIICISIKCLHCTIKRLHIFYKSLKKKKESRYWVLNVDNPACLRLDIWLHNRMSYLDIFLLILVRVKGTVSIVRKPRPPSTWPLPPVLLGALQGISRPAGGHSLSNVLRSAPRPPLSWACPKHLPSTLTCWPMKGRKLIFALVFACDTDCLDMTQSW